MIYSIQKRFWKNMLNQIYATKDTQTQVFHEGKRLPVTILKVENHTVIGSKTQEKDGYAAQVLTVKSSPRIVREVKSSEISETKEINLSEILTPGATVMVAGISKGKGFSGVMKRHGFHGGQRTHGQSDRLRAPGSIGRGTTPGRIVKGKKMAGHMGSENVAVKNLKIHSFDSATGRLLVTGLIPGSRGTLTKVTITKQAK